MRLGAKILEHAWPQWLISGAVVVGLYLSRETAIGTRLLPQLDAAARTSLYTMLGGIFGSLLGFVITATALLLTVINHPRLVIVTESKSSSRLWGIHITTIYVLGGATIASVVGLLYDAPAGNQGIGYTVLFFSLLVTLRISSCVWVLKNVIALVTEADKRLRATGNDPAQQLTPPPAVGIPGLSQAPNP